MSSRYRITARLGVTLCALTAAFSLAACGGSGGAEHSAAPASTAPTTTAASSASSPAPKPTRKAAAVNPLTGLAPSTNPVVAVKVEDTPWSRPQVGLDQADIVYIEQVEGGLTRLVAVFDTHLPTAVEPVRSTRANDPEIMAQYGPVIYVASGGSRAEYYPLNHSPLKQVINDHGGPGFHRDNSRTAPDNLVVNLQEVVKAVKGPRAKSIGLYWSAKLANPSTGGTVVSTTVGATPVVFKYNAKWHRYYRYFDGHLDTLANGHYVSTPNVIVQFVKGNVFAKDIDPAGNPAWYQHTLGSGDVVVFRDGRRIEGHWSRPHALSGTSLVDAKGKPIMLKPGGAWFVLVNNGGHV